VSLRRKAIAHTLALGLRCDRIVKDLQGTTINDCRHQKRNTLPREGLSPLMEAVVTAWEMVRGCEPKVSIGRLSNEGQEGMQENWEMAPLPPFAGQLREGDPHSIANRLLTLAVGGMPHYN